jgi:Zn-dependent protease with chaperone function
LSLPFSFLVGLFVVVAHRELGGALPGEGRVDDLVWTAALLVTPWLLAVFARATALQSLVTGRRSAVPPRALLRLSSLATPLVLHALFELGLYGDWIDRLAPDSHILRVVLTLLPLYVAELPRIVMATMAEALVESGFEARASRPVSPMFLPSWSEIWPSVRLRFGWPLLAVMPALLYGVGMDLLELWRWGYVVVLATAAGTSLAAMGYLLVAAALLPFWFRIAFGVQNGIPEPFGSVLRETALRLGFSPRRLFVLPTGMRAVNAMMVGPLPIGRLLCFTDGLLKTLDPRSLAGVLAHEVGHARMGHPGLLTLLGFVVPVMLMSPLRLLDPEQGDVVLLSVVMLGGALLVWLALRTLARRFEHEADISSVQVLGAEPCSRALLTVSRSTLPANNSLRGRLMSLHPDEQLRLETMRRYEIEPGFRQRFDRQTVRLRRAVAVVLLFAVGVGVWFWSVDWPREQVVVQFHTGDFVGARASLAQLEDVPPRWRDAMARIEAQLDRADELQPGLRDWPSVERALVPAAWQRGEQVLLREGPAAAHPWLSLAITAMPSVSTTQHAIYEYCAAAADKDPDRMLRLGRIVLQRGPPPQLMRVFRGYQ